MESGVDVAMLNHLQFLSMIHIYLLPLLQAGTV